MEQKPGMDRDRELHREMPLSAATMAGSKHPFPNIYTLPVKPHGSFGARKKNDNFDWAVNRPA